MAQKKKEAEKSGNQESEDFDFGTFRQQVIAGLMRGEGLTGENGLLKPLIANFVQGALASEMDDHLAQEKEAGVANRRNGKQSKDIRSQAGAVRIEYDRDRAGTFEPVTV
ncbi:MAG TPA: transposase, partial [Haliscomenobacter sp.]|nr:transposase [Haliscomenobacter sp.]